MPSLHEAYLPLVTRLGFDNWDIDEVYEAFHSSLQPGARVTEDPRDAWVSRRLTAGREAWWAWEHAPDPSPCRLADCFAARWLDLVVERGRVDLVLALARPGHAGAGEVLAKHFDELLRESPGSAEAHETVAVMADVGHPFADDALKLLEAANAAAAPSAYRVGVDW